MGQSKNDSKRGPFRLGRKPAILLSAVAVIALAIPAVADAKKKGKKGGPKVTVMTRNVYLGADLTPAIDAANLPEAIDAAGGIVSELDSTKFPERAAPLAREIKESKADLVGLQEVALWEDQTPSDGGSPPISPIGTPATNVRYDFLALIEAELKKIGAKYEVIGVQEEFEAELPANTDGNPNNGLLGAELDARLTMRDVILAKKGSKVKTGKVDSANYVNRFETEVGGLPVAADRGWLSVEAKVGGKGKGKSASASKKKGGGKFKFRFINTHLEAFGDPTIREAQAEELIAGPANTNKQVILVGDLNSGLPERHATGQYEFQPGDPLAFQAFVAAGFKDNGAVHSCCDDPLDPNRVFDHTVDHVLTKPGLKTKKAFVTGNDPGERTPSGLWPSDHGGVVSKLQLKK
ncbi:MAG: endonuclease/exonuclease/phosphatase family protein [Solirubrobacterales bacterium]